MKHSHLVSFALGYLKRTCVFFTTAGVAEERPDAIGWMASGQSILFEAKSSRKDLIDEWARKDRKPFRRAKSGGLGVLRTYITPPGLVSVGEVENWGWGLMEVHSGRLKRVAESEIWTPDWLLEIRILSGICSKVKFVPKEKQIPLAFSNVERNGAEKAPSRSAISR